MKSISIAVLGVIVGVLLVLLLGKSPIQHKPSASSDVVLERMMDVQKLVTVEGHFSEVYDYKDYLGVDLWPFRKKALIKVKATALLGYDLDQWQYQINKTTKTLEISSIPPAEILSLDHDLQYYDLSEGAFNSFTTQDYNNLQEQAKNFIEDQIKKSDLFLFAQKNLYEHLHYLEETLEAVGWKMIYPPAPS